MISEVKRGADDAQRLADSTRGVPIKPDRNDVNDPSGHFPSPTVAELPAFRDALRTRLAMPVVRRYSGAQDIQAACGRLAAVTS